MAFAAAAGGFLYVAHFVPPLAALVVLRRRGQATPAFATPLPGAVLPLAFAACAVLLAGSGVAGAAGGLGWLAAGLAGHRLWGSLSRAGPPAWPPA